MANEQERIAKQKRFGKKAAGVTLFWVGVVLVIITVIIFGMALYSVGIAYFAPYFWDCFIMLFIASLMIVAGAILYFVGRSEAKKAKNQKTPLV